MLREVGINYLSTVVKATVLDGVDVANGSASAKMRPGRGPILHRGSPRCYCTDHEIGQGAPQPTRNAKFRRGGILSLDSDWGKLQAHKNSTGVIK